MKAGLYADYIYLTVIVWRRSSSSLKIFWPKSWSNQDKVPRKSLGGENNLMQTHPNNNLVVDWWILTTIKIQIML